MAAFLKQHQQVRSDERRNKLVRRVFLRIRQISLVVLVWFVFVGLIYGFYQLLFTRGIFIVKNVDIEGQISHMSEAAILASSGVPVGANLFAVDLKKVRANVSQDPWVKEVAVARKLPSTIWIYVNEYQPYAVLVTDDLYMVDNSGVIFKKVANGDDKNLPALTGFTKGEDVTQAIELLKIYATSPMADYYTPAEVHVDDARGCSIIFMENGVVVRLGFDGAAEKLERLYSMIGAIGSSKEKIRYIDLNIPGKVVVKYES